MMYHTHAGTPSSKARQLVRYQAKRAAQRTWLVKMRRFLFGSAVYIGRDEIKRIETNADLYKLFAAKGA